MRLRAKLLLAFGLALISIVAVQVWVGSVMLGWLPDGGGAAGLALVALPGIVALISGTGVMAVIDHLVAKPVHRVLDVAASLAPADGAAVASSDELTGMLATLSAAKQCIDKERAAAEEQHRALLKAQRAAVSATETKQAFLANITHEVRTPLNGLVGSLALLGETAQTLEQAELTNAATDSANRLAGLMEQVLDLTEASDGSLHLDPEELDLVRLFGSVVDESRQLAPDHRFTYAFAAGGPRMAIADAGRLRQILTELLKNATRATDGGKVAVALTTTTEGQRLRVRVDVEDDGPGIPDELRAAVFEPFTQVDDTFTRPHDGPGLGLALCQRLLQRMGGELGVDRRPGGGSRFWFQVRLPDPDASTASLDDVDADATGGSSTPAVRIVVLEPDPATRSRLVGLLAEQGEASHLVADWHELGDALSRHAYELALVRVDDVHRDPELVQRLRRAADEANQLTALIAVTAARTNARLLLLEQGWDDAVAAPLTRRGTAEVIASWLVPPSDRLAG